MSELKRRIILEKKGDETDISVRELVVILKWTAEVDLDLLAFYQTKDGRTGGVFSDNYPGGTRGNLNKFPFIELDHDASVGASSGEKEEMLRISELGDMAEVYIVTINYTDAIANTPSTFRNYDSSVSVMNERWDSIEVPLNSPEKGHVAVVCKIDNTSHARAKLVNLNKIMDFKDFMTTIPGANMFVRLKFTQ